MAVHDTISDSFNIHFVVTEECGHSKYTLSDGEAAQATAACSGFALTHILFPGGVALGWPREMSSLQGVDRANGDYTRRGGRGGTLRKLNISSSKLMKRRVDGEPPKKDGGAHMKASLMWDIVEERGGKSKVALKKVWEERWRQPEIRTPQQWFPILRYATV